MHSCIPVLAPYFRDGALFALFFCILSLLFDISLLFPKKSVLVYKGSFPVKVWWVLPFHGSRGSVDVKRVLVTFQVASTIKMEVNDCKFDACMCCVRIQVVGCMK